MTGRIAGDDRDCRGARIDGRPPAPFQMIGGEVQHRREHAIQIELVHLADLLSLGRLEHRIGGDGVRLPAADAKPSHLSAGQIEDGLGRRTAVAVENEPDFARQLLGVLARDANDAAAAGGFALPLTTIHCWSISGTRAMVPTSPETMRSFIRCRGST